VIHLRAKTVIPAELTRNILTFGGSIRQFHKENDTFIAVEEWPHRNWFRVNSGHAYRCFNCPLIDVTAQLGHRPSDWRA